MTIRVHGANGAERLGYFQGDNALVRVELTGGEVAVAATNVVHSGDDLEVLFMDSGIDTSTWTNIPEESRTVIDGKGVKVVYTTKAHWDEAFNAQRNYRLLVDALQQRSVIIAVNSNGEVTTDAGAGLDGDFVSLAGTKLTVLIERAAVWDKAVPNQYGQLDIQGSAALAANEGVLLAEEFAALATAGVFYQADGTMSTGTTVADTAFSKQLPEL